ncbi:MAG TPA: carbohydrate kinase family protein [Chthonomonadaceae bacterium]|nr:carbohydrate kinase family protein [Chthonomonadaceae bacterium]
MPPARLGRALLSALRLAWDRIGLVIAMSLMWALLLCLPLAVGRLLPALLPPPARDAITALVAALLLSAPAAGIFQVAHLLCSQDEVSYLDLWRGAWRLFGPATRLGLIHLVVSGLFAVNLWFYLQLGHAIGIAATIFCLYALLFWGMMAAYHLPVLVAQETGVFDTPERRARRGAVSVLRRAFFLALGDPFYTLGLLAALLLIVALTLAALLLRFPALLAVIAVLWVLLWPSVAALLATQATRALLVKYGVLPLPSAESPVPDEPVSDQSLRAHPYPLARSLRPQGMGSDKQFRISAWRFNAVYGEKKPEVTCVGIVVADVVGKPIDELPERGKLALVERMELHSGGCAANTGIGLAKLGVETAIIGKVGTDGFGDFLVCRFESFGIDAGGVARDPEAATSATMVLVHGDGERSFLHYLGANATLRLEDIDFERVRRSKILHIAGALVMPALDGAPTAELLRRAKEAGITTAFDTVWDARGRWMELVAPSLPYVDYLLPNYEEARMLAGGREEPSDIARFLLDAGAKVVGLKLGERGCYVRAADGTEITVPALPVTAVDALGAGDAYVAGFLAGVVRGWDLEQCARFANATGACCVTALGATTGIQSFEETLAFLQRCSPESANPPTQKEA